METYTRIERIIHSQPWAITPEMLDVIACVVARRMESNEPMAAVFPNGNQSQRDKVDVQDGIAVVPINGVLMRKASMLGDISGALSYPQIRGRVTDAMSSEAQTVVLKIDSPGGEVMGAQETADAIYNARQDSNKRLIAFTDGRMCSAAYWLGSQCDMVIASADSEIGSIGIISKIQDTSRREKNVGEDSIVMRTGPNKGLGAGPVTDDQLQQMREIMDEHFGAFVGSVERGRKGPVSEDAKTGRIYTGAMGVRRGLVDANMTFTQLLAKYASR